MTNNNAHLSAVQQVRAAARPYSGPADLKSLLARAGQARLVCVGKASHGTSQFYGALVQITKRLIEEHGFNMVVVEADEHACVEIDKCVRLALGDHRSPDAVLSAQLHWPSWMWANSETIRFATWLRSHNGRRPPEQRVGWHGLDEFGLWEATRRTLGYVREIWPDQAGRVTAALDAPLNGRSMVPDSHVESLARRLARKAGDSSVRRRAELYYRAMLRGGDAAGAARAHLWLDMVDRLLNRDGPKTRIVVWAHNTHVGDSRGIGDEASGSPSFGRLLRERYGPGDVVLVGCAGGPGSVVAARRRGAAMEKIAVPSPRAGSLDALLAQAVPDRPALFLFQPGETGWTAETRDQRAIGAVYDPDFYGESYVPTRPGERYDALLWFPRQTPVEARHLEARWAGQVRTLRQPSPS